MLQQRFNLGGPLILAPMAGGPTTPELVAAACEAGAFGMLDGAYRTPAGLASAIAQVRAATQRPFGINLFVSTSPPPLKDSDIARARRDMMACCASLGAFEAPLQRPYTEDFEQQFAVVLQHAPAVLSFTFGLLTHEHIAACHARNILAVGCATTLVEARMLESAGVDGIVAQGTEAGGHRGIFDARAPEPGIDTITLCKTFAAQLRVPFFAAGGLMDGAAIAAVLSAGADAAQLGTAFLLCPEAATSAPYRQALSQHAHAPTALTRAFSGRLARGLENRFTARMRAENSAVLPFPAQNTLTRAMRARSVAQGNSDYLSLWAGAGHQSLRAMGAGQLVRALLEEAR